MDFTKRVLKQKYVKDKNVMIVELKGYLEYAIITLDYKGNVIYSHCKSGSANSSYQHIIMNKLKKESYNLIRQYEMEEIESESFNYS